MLRNQLIERATIEAYHDSFRLVGIAGLLLVPIVLLIRGESDRDGKTARLGRRAARHGTNNELHGTEISRNYS